MAVRAGAAAGSNLRRVRKLSEKFQLLSRSRENHEKFAFISRHVPTADQVAIAATIGIELVHVGDRDAFAFSVSDAEKLREEFVGVVCVHPLIAVNCVLANLNVGVFENINRAEVGAPPQFKASRLVVRCRVVVADAGEAAIVAAS